MVQQRLLSTQQIAQHNNAKDCWIVVDGQVWDLTEFAPNHPGGAGSKQAVEGNYNTLSNNSKTEAIWQSFFDMQGEMPRKRIRKFTALH